MDYMADGDRSTASVLEQETADEFFDGLLLHGNQDDDDDGLVR